MSGRLKYSRLIKNTGELARMGSNIFEIFFLKKIDFFEEKIFDRGGGARYPLLCKFLAR